MSEQNRIIVNHVMSQDIYSGILDAFIGFLRAGSTMEHLVSEKPLEEAHVYHYHRPHLESKLLPSSIVTVHHDLEDTDPWLKLAKFLPRYAEAAKVVCLNTGQQAKLANLGLTHTEVVPHGYHRRIFRQKPMTVYDPTRKLTLGVVSKRYGRRVKGEAYLLEIMKRISPDRFRFIFVGEGRQAERGTAVNLGFEASAYERLPYRMFNGLYHSMDFLLMTSLFEGGPANIPEALATATPILSTRVGMATDFIQESINGLFLAGDPDSDAGMLAAIASNRNGMTDRLLQGARRLTGLAPTWEDVAARYRAIYTETLEENGTLLLATA